MTFSVPHNVVLDESPSVCLSVNEYALDVFDGRGTEGGKLYQRRGFLCNRCLDLDGNEGNNEKAAKLTSCSVSPFPLNAGLIGFRSSFNPKHLFVTASSLSI